MSFAANQLWQQVTGTMPDEAARGLNVTFEVEHVEDTARSNAEGRLVTIEKEFIEIRSPNDPFSAVRREVSDADRRVFPQAYKAWKEGLADPVSGTPLKEWTPIARSQAEFLAIRGVRTVEQLADVSDDGCQHLGHGYLTLRNKAVAWLKQAKDASAATQMATELQKRDTQIRVLERQVQELIAKLSKDEEAPTPKKSKQ